MEILAFVGFFLLTISDLEARSIPAPFDCQKAQCAPHPDLFRCTVTLDSIEDCCSTYKCLDENGGMYMLYGSNNRDKFGSSAQGGIFYSSGPNNKDGNVMFQSSSSSSSSDFGNVPPMNMDYNFGESRNQIRNFRPMDFNPFQNNFAYEPSYPIFPFPQNGRHHSGGQAVPQFPQYPQYPRYQPPIFNPFSFMSNFG